jgi:hypothetical protein
VHAHDSRLGPRLSALLDLMQQSEPFVRGWEKMDVWAKTGRVSREPVKDCPGRIIGETYC